MGRNKIITLTVFGILSITANAQTIQVHPLVHAPVLDGKGGDWKAIQATVIPLRPIAETTVVEAKEVQFKAGRFGDTVYFYARWRDSEEDRVHKPYVWDKEKERYVRGQKKEDRFAMQFAMDGEYTTDWYAAEYFKADMWHWKAHRSDLVGVAHDKMTVIDRRPLMRAAQLRDPQGGIAYVLRPGDSGVQPYSTMRHRRYKKDEMPKYRLNHNVSGSVADVKAKGRWSDGYWVLELSRKLDTGHEDDAVFKLGESLKGGIGIFDRSAVLDHVVSETLTFQF
jgi:hypothetical protein